MEVSAKIIHGSFVFGQSPTLKRTLSEEMMLNMGEVERPGPKRDDAGDAGELMAKNPFYSLLGDCYTIVVRETTTAVTRGRSNAWEYILTCFKDAKNKRQRREET